MPVTYRAQIIWEHQSLLPRDRMTINPCFHDPLVLTDAAELAEDLANGINSWMGTGTTYRVTVKMYDVNGTPPVFPAGEFTANPSGAGLGFAVDRDVACCLSFWGGTNIPRHRGRLYIPAGLVGSASDLQDRVPSSVSTKVAALVPVFTGLGGVNIDWCVYSPTNDSHVPVSNWFIDNEWDTVRSRGLKASSRVAGTTSE